MRVTIIDRYILKQLIFPFVMGMAGFTILLSIDPLVDAMQYIINQKIDYRIVWSWFFNRLPSDMVYTFPMAMLFAALMTIGRLSKDSELTAIKAGGISVYRISYPVLFFALLVSIGALIFNEKIVPYTNRKAKFLKEKKILKITKSQTIEKALLRIPPDKIIYGGIVNPKIGKIFKVLLVFLKKGQISRILIARSAAYNFKTRLWTFKDGRFYLIDDKDSRLKSRFRMMVLKLNITPAKFKRKEKRPREMSMKELRKYIEECAAIGSENLLPLKVDFYLKTSIPFASFIFAFIGIAMGLRPNRGGAFIGFGTSIIVIFVYYVIMSFGRSYGRAGVLPPAAAAWIQNVVFAIVGIYYIYKADES